MMGPSAKHHRSLNRVEVMPQFRFKFTKWLYIFKNLGNLFHSADITKLEVC